LLLLSLGAALGFADYRWRANSAGLLRRLQPGGVSPRRAAFCDADLEGLPAPVMRYFRAVLRDGQPFVRRARFSQRGEFLVRPAQGGWRPFNAAQHVATDPPGFVWDARIRMAPGLAIRVRDSFVDGTGSMLGKILGLFPMVSVEATPEIAAGALHRYLAEAVWFPTALLPARGVVWTPLDDSRARATLSVAATTVWLDVSFGDDGLVRSVFTPARARALEGRAVPTPWQGRFADYAERDGMRIPLAGEVEWLLPEGPQVYWRGRITDIAYEYAEAC
jgi:hypothetical protein